MLSTVVLPAPFGPIIEKSWPASTSRLTFVTAWTPPNDFETSRISTCALMCPEGGYAPLPEPPPRTGCGGKAAARTPFRPGWYVPGLSVPRRLTLFISTPSAGFAGAPQWGCLDVGIWGPSGVKDAHAAV